MDLEHIIIQYTNEKWEAEAFTKRGYEAIECAFGLGSVMGPLHMDHHGEESWREGVALRACRDHYGARKDDARFVVTGTPDADAILAIIALAAAVPQESIPMTFVELVNRRDLDPISIDLLSEEYGEELLSFQQISHLQRNTSSFYRAIRGMAKVLLNPLTDEQRSQIRRKEERRIRMAEDCYSEQLSRDVLLVQGNIWGFDRWYKNAPIVVSYSQRHKSVTVGCISEEKASEYLGENGLIEVFTRLGKGWGGREAIGGSPRHKQLSFEEARKAGQLIVSILREKGF